MTSFGNWTVAKLLFNLTLRLIYLSLAIMLKSIFLLNQVVKLRLMGFYHEKLNVLWDGPDGLNQGTENVFI